MLSGQYSYSKMCTLPGDVYQSEVLSAYLCQCKIIPYFKECKKIAYSRPNMHDNGPETWTEMNLSDMFQSERGYMHFYS